MYASAMTAVGSPKSPVPVLPKLLGLVLVLLWVLPAPVAGVPHDSAADLVSRLAAVGGVDTTAVDGLGVATQIVPDRAESPRAEVLELAAVTAPAWLRTAASAAMLHDRHTTGSDQPVTIIRVSAEATVLGAAEAARRQFTAPPAASAPDATGSAAAALLTTLETNGTPGYRVARTDVDTDISITADRPGVRPD